MGNCHVSGKWPWLADGRDWERLRLPLEWQCEGPGGSFPGSLLVICALCSVPWFSQQSERAPSHSHSLFCYLLISMFLKAVWSCFGLSSVVIRCSGQFVAGLTPSSAHMCADTGPQNPLIYPFLSTAGLWCKSQPWFYPGVQLQNLTIGKAPSWSFSRVHLFVLSTIVKHLGSLAPKKILFPAFLYRRYFLPGTLQTKQALRPVGGLRMTFSSGARQHTTGDSDLFSFCVYNIAPLWKTLARLQASLKQTLNNLG